MREHSWDHNTEDLAKQQSRGTGPRENWVTSLNDLTSENCLILSIAAGSEPLNRKFSAENQMDRTFAAIKFPIIWECFARLYLDFFKADFHGATLPTGLRHVFKINPTTRLSLFRVCLICTSQNCPRILNMF